MFEKPISLHSTLKINKFCNLICRNKCTNNSNTYFRDKFNKGHNNHDFIEKVETEVNEHCSKEKNVMNMNFMLTEVKLMKHIRKLRMVCASRINGITAEHVKWASGINHKIAVHYIFDLVY